MTHTIPSQHDAEEAMRPYLAAMFDAVDVLATVPAGATQALLANTAEVAHLTRQALAKALDLLGVQQ